MKLLSAFADNFVAARRCDRQVAQGKERGAMNKGDHAIGLSTAKEMVSIAASHGKLTV